jgi:predicted TIM-barrel fold metal-dependent hydrolase
MKRKQSRRQFLGSTVGLGAGALLSGPLGWSAEPVEPSLMATRIIDTHTHFYDPSRPQGVPWPAKEDKDLYRTVLPKDYLALSTPQRVAGTVVVEASSWIDDNQWILDLAKHDPFIVGFVGNLPIGSEGFSDHLSRFSENSLFRGLRIGGHRLKARLEQRDFGRDLGLLAEKDLSLDLLGGSDMLEEVARLAQQFPRLRLVIDHVAGAKIDGGVLDPSWLRGMEAAGKERNVWCKVSGLVEGTGLTDGRAPRDQKFYKPVLDAVWNVFGPDRLIYGSNWPVSERFADLGFVQQLVSDYFAAKGKTALDHVFWQNAKTVYKWVARS